MCLSCKKILLLCGRACLGQVTSRVCAQVEVVGLSQRC